MIGFGLGVLFDEAVAILGLRTLLGFQSILALHLFYSVAFGFDEGLGRDRPQYTAHLVLVFLALVRPRLRLGEGLSCACDRLVETVLPLHGRFLPILAFVQGVRSHRRLGLIRLRFGSDLSAREVLSLGLSVVDGKIGGVPGSEFTFLGTGNK